MSSSMKSARFIVYYWPIPFRGNFIKTLLAYKEIPYTEATPEEVLALKTASLDKQPTPFMAPPAVHDTQEDVFLAQLPAVCFYLSKELRLLPSDSKKQALCLKVVGDCNDVLDGITRCGGAQMWTPDAWKQFTGERLVRWLQIFEELGARNDIKKSGFMLGTEQATLADLSVHALLATMERCLPELSPVLRKHAPQCMALVDRISSNSPGVAALVKKQTEQYGNVYCSGQIEASIRSMLSMEGE